MDPPAVRGLLAVGLVVALTLLGAGRPTVVAAPDDVCPEPNDSFQQACYLGPDADALGFISRPNDTDAYRFEVLDFEVGVYIELAERPLPYQTVRVNVDGQDKLVVADGDLMGGRVGFGAATWGPPVTIHYDNVLVTSPPAG